MATYSHPSSSLWESVSHSVSFRYREGDNILLKVTDTGLGMSREELESLKSRVLSEDTTSFGLTSSYKRLKILYGDACRFDIESLPQEGTSIMIEIPGKADIDNETIL